MLSEARCRTTHLQLLTGNCPWCEIPIGNRPATMGPQSHSAGERRWDIPRMKSDLDHEVDEVRLITVLNAQQHLPDVPEAAGVLRIALRNSVDRVKENATIALALLGNGMSAEAIHEYEAASRSEPGDFALRILLLGHYLRSQFVSNAARMARRAHIHWIIENAPESRIAGTPFAHLDDTDDPAYEQAMQLWMSQIEAHPENTVILGNAAGFLTPNDKTKCGELLRHAKTLEPDNPEWSNRLGHLYSLEMIGKDAAARRDWAAMTQAEYEREQGLYRDERERLRQLPRLAEAAFEAGDYAKARTYASELLARADAGHKGKAIFCGNQVLGRLALVDGDVGGAKAHLLASAETTGSPTLCSFGPSMVLAGELLARGERDAVLRYLERCSSFWAYGAEWLARWASAIERDETPDFRAYKE
jgi:tetratricopeptide (TPR) repeat protein